MSEGFELYILYVAMIHTGILPVVIGGFMWEIGGIRGDWEYHNRLKMLHKDICWHIYGTPWQEAYSSVNRQLCHCLSMRFGHMRHTTHFLCNTNKRGEEGGR